MPKPLRMTLWQEMHMQLLCSNDRLSGAVLVATRLRRTCDNAGSVVNGIVGHAVSGAQYVLRVITSITSVAAATPKGI